MVDESVEAKKTAIPNMRADQVDEARQRRQKQRQASDYYKPSQTVQRRVEKEKARTSAQKRAIKTNCRKILAQKTRENERTSDQGDGLVESEEQLNALNASLPEAVKEHVEEEPEETPTR